MFLWRRVRPRLRPLLALYPLAMALTLIATGEHYFFDILLGWLYAGAAMAAWGRWERRGEGAQGVRRRSVAAPSTSASTVAPTITATSSQKRPPRSPGPAARSSASNA
jgi:PAP2 superfamily